ncbi:hypothetical protein GCM10008955_19330 [Deinococcus malanensis]|uniref:Uncharacterized protein n=1 Tax=Deinococcus malanensis TaxID=1706855 RepID=A0ABQ2EUS5_9DEIO|nr:hypothetical protein GCM10008955_19330 [Deinococcus malanensis]
MSKPLNVTINVTWRPRRFAVRWAECEKEVPLWDVWHTGELVKLPEFGPREEHPDFPILEDMADLPTQDRERWEQVARQWGGYGSSWQQRGPLWRTLVQENRSGQESVFDDGPPFPRLVRAWPGDSRAVRPLADDPGKPSLVEESWPPKNLKVYADIANLARKIPDEAAFRSGVIDLAHRYAMLNPKWGDTLFEWQKCSLGFHYLRETYRHLHGVSPKDKEFRDPESLVAQWNEAYCQSKIYRSAALVMGTPSLPAAHFVAVAASLAKYSAFPLRTLRRELADFLRQEHVEGDFGYAPRQVAKGIRSRESVGAYLRCGAMAWGFHELAELFAVDPVRQCQVCGKPMEKRRGARTCSVGCRQKHSRQKRAVDIGFPVG